MIFVNAIARHARVPHSCAVVGVPGERCLLAGVTERMGGNPLLAKPKPQSADTLSHHNHITRQLCEKWKRCK
jgi:hypothetical protein